jgi:hypothetical protein
MKPIPSPWKYRPRAGDWVKVRCKEDILRTLDKDGRLDGLPFMPEMLAYCGMKLRVDKRAHKTCDTVNDYKGRRMMNAVHLEDVRCNGEMHGGCEAGCLTFWKLDWLLPADDSQVGRTGETLASQPAVHCTEQDVLRAASASTAAEPGVEAKLRYFCQATQIPSATTPLSRWDIRQYWEDYRSGNVGILRILRGFIYFLYNSLVNSGLGIGLILRKLYDVFQFFWGGPPYPRNHGLIPVGQPTPTGKIDLVAGEWVSPKPYKTILSTCDKSNKNRGMVFDGEMVPYIPGKYQVLRRVNRIINEKTGQMMEMKNPCIILNSVTCQARYSSNRMFCPRAINLYWREIWLERTSPPEPDSTKASEPSKPM